MPYTMEYSHYFKKIGLSTETKLFKVNGNSEFTLDSIAETLNVWICAENGQIKSDSIITCENGDEIFFKIYYNGVWCKKYRRGVK